MARDRIHHTLLHHCCIFIFALTAVSAGLLPRVAWAQDAKQQVLDAMNAARAENGLAPLVANSLLDQAAQGHVNDMINNYVYGHYGSDGSSVQVRVARTGYSTTPWVSENWVSASSANGAMRWWMGDYIHRVNILTPRWVEVGVGVGTRGSEMIFVTVFSAGGGLNSDEAAIAAAEMQKQQAAPPPPSVRIEQVSVPPEGLDYTVVGGDTLLAIGLRYGLPWETIAAANGLDEHSLLQIGQGLRIPGSGTPAAPKVEVPTEEYTVQPNDTLFTIAARRGMYWDEVAAVNGFGEHTILQIGQVIKVPVVEEEVVPVTTFVVEARADVMRPITPEQSPANLGNYTLLKFDPDAAPDAASAEAIASTGVGGPLPGAESGSAAQVAMAESPGMGATSAVLAAYEASSSFAESAPAESVTAEIATTDSAAESEATLYAVQAGDTIISIAIQHGLAWGGLLQLNGLTENSVLQPGQMLRLR